MFIERTSSSLRKAAEGVVEVLYPRRCSGCGLRGVWVCGVCLAALPLFREPLCLRCGVPIDRSCRCSYVPPEIETLRSAGPYDGWLREAIHRMKYQGESARAAHLGSLMVNALSDVEPAEALVAVPLHPNRLKERGFNQSALLTRHLAEAIGVPIWDALSRTRDTRHQVELPGEDRHANVRGAFAYRAGTSLSPARVVLIDDVFTTGATIGECAVTLKNAGVLQVQALTVC